MAEFLNNNVKYLRTTKKISQQNLADAIGVDRSTVSRIENGEIETTVDNAIKIAKKLDVSLNDLVNKDLRFDNAELIDITSDIIKIPIYGTIQAGVPLECQSDIIDYIEIPKNWTRGGKKFYGLQLSGDSMFPKYNDKDVVIFEQNNDVQAYNGKDVAVMINRTESTFKKIKVTEQGIILQPYNPDYDIMTFSKKQVEELPITVIGIARERRTKVE